MSTLLQDYGVSLQFHSNKILSYSTSQIKVYVPFSSYDDSTVWPYWKRQLKKWWGHALRKQDAHVKMHVQTQGANVLLVIKTAAVYSEKNNFLQHVIEADIEGAIQQQDSELIHLC